VSAGGGVLTGAGGWTTESGREGADAAVLPNPCPVVLACALGHVELAPAMAELAPAIARLEIEGRFGGSYCSPRTRASSTRLASV